MTNRIGTILFIASVLTPNPVAAQIVTANPTQTYLPVLAPFPSDPNGAGTNLFCQNAPSRECIDPRQGISLTHFATASDLNRQTGALTDQIAAINRQVASLSTSLGSLATLNTRLDAAVTSVAALSAQITTMNAQVADFNTQVSSLNVQFGTVNNQISKAFQLVAVSAALKDAIPNAGDRFAIRLNTAGFSGQFAGAIGAALNVGDRVRFSANYGRSSSQSILSGGMNLSF